MLLRPFFLFLLGGLLALLSLPMAGLAQPYEVVRGKQFQLCHDMAKNLNEFKNEPPMVCERKISPKYKDFRLPNWQPLPLEQALQAALALNRARMNPRGEPHREAKAEKEAGEIREAAAQGKLKAWEATFDIARSGTRQRVVMATRGRACVQTKEGWDLDYEPILGVLVDGKYEIDDRFQRFSTIKADVIFYKGLPYLASWDTYPGAIGRGDPGPAKEHRGYVFVWDVFWLKWDKGLYERGKAGFKGPICQIGYQRLK